MTIDDDVRGYLDGLRHHVEHGNMLHVLPLLPADYFDSAVCDPPYELGFMGRTWDRSGVAFQRETWATVLRVLKPGAHLVAFGGSRTAHRIACAIEDAGFEIRDSFEWLYGCLSDDTEILVDGKWRHHSEAVAGRHALCFDVDSNSFSWAPIQGRVDYDYDDVAFRIRSADTDQIVSKNHRCIVERDGRLGFVLAEEAAQGSEIRVPVLEDVPGLLGALRCAESLPGSAKRDVLSGVRVEADQRVTDGPTEQASQCADRMPDLRAVVPSSAVLTSRPAPDVLAAMPRDTGCGSSASPSVARARRLDGGVHGLVPSQHERASQSGMEGRGYLLPKARELPADQVCAVSGGVPAYGSEGRVCDGAPSARRDGDRSMPFTTRSRAPRESRSDGQRAREPRTIRLQPGSQAVRASRFTRTVVARIEPFHYRGSVWCIRVPTGAFVARRNGRTFVTGNSGFPKSLDVSKAIDAAAGAEREVLATEERWNEASGIVDAGRGERKWITRNITAPATAPAKEWSGYGTALKPGHEPIILARKPLDGNVAANVLKHGTGALNIDGCRVGASKRVPGSPKQAPASTHTVSLPGFDGGSGHDPNIGRWPPNVLFQHSASCKAIGTRAIKSNPSWDTPNRATEPSAFTGATVSQVRHAEDAVVEYVCDESCPVLELDRQSGVTRETPHVRGGNRGVYGGFTGPGLDDTTRGHRDEGTASRFFPQFEWQPELDDVPRFYYTAKAARGERDRGLDWFRSRSAGETVGRDPESAGANNPRAGAGRGAGAAVYRCALCGLNLQGGRAVSPCPAGEAHVREFVRVEKGARNPHPTCKPVDLLRWLVRLVTRPKGIVLDPFAGVGSCGIAAALEGFRYLGVELNDTDDEPFVSVARARLAWVQGAELKPRKSLQAGEGTAPRQQSLFAVDDEDRK